MDPALFSKSSEIRVNGHRILSNVPENITVSPCTNTSAGCFLGFKAVTAKSSHSVPFGKLKHIRFMSISRFTDGWTTPTFGSNGRQLNKETQMMMLDKDSGRPYVLLLPILEGPFKASIESCDDDDDDNIYVSVKSGSTVVAEASYHGVIYMHASNDPFSLLKEAMKVVKARLGTFNLLEEKTPPGIVDKFGWCTRNAMSKVHTEGIWKGVNGLVEGGCPPGFVLIDDGWQSAGYEEAAPGQKPLSLNKLEANRDFRNYRSHRGSGTRTPEEGLGAFVKDLKEDFKTVAYVYVWHAFKTRTGVVPQKNMDKMSKELGSVLKAAAIDGVKMDISHVRYYGGRVEVAEACYKTVTDSVREHFKGNGVIASKEQCNDFMLLGTEAISLGLAGAEQNCDTNNHHMVNCAYNSLWMGNFIQPDWNMFQSTHQYAAFNTASRAISGGPIYVSDLDGKHNFELLKRLALPDGSILRCENYALPTKDCLFKDPLRDGKTMLKIWNLNKYTGVLGAFNCQEGGQSKGTRQNNHAAKHSQSVFTKTSPKDIEWKASKKPISIKESQVFALYLFQDKKLFLSKPTEKVDIALEPFNFELITVSPVTVLPRISVQFAPIGLVNMLNTGGAIQSLNFDERKNLIEVGVKGSGEFRVFASKEPVACSVDGITVDVKYEANMVVTQVSWPSSSRLSLIKYKF